MTDDDISGLVIQPHRRIPRRTFILWLPVFAIASGISIRILTDWRRRSTPRIRARLLDLAPLGSSFETVEAVIQSESWSYSVDKNRGFFDQRSHPARIVGTTHIEANLGNYVDVPLPFITNITVFWGFDAQGQLIDIWVWRTN